MRRNRKSQAWSSCFTLNWVDWQTQAEHKTKDKGDRKGIKIEEQITFAMTAILFGSRMRESFETPSPTVQSEPHALLYAPINWHSLKQLCKDHQRDAEHSLVFS